MGKSCKIVRSLSEGTLDFPLAVGYHSKIASTNPKIVVKQRILYNKMGVGYSGFIRKHLLSIILFTAVTPPMEGNRVVARPGAADNEVLTTRAIDVNHIEVTFKDAGYSFDAEAVRLEGPAEIVNIAAAGKIVSLETTDLSYRQHYYISIENYGRRPVNLGALFDEISTRQELGFQVENGKTRFRLFAPRADRVTLILFETYDAAAGVEHDMKSSSDGVWEVSLQGVYWGKYYGYQVSGPEAPFEKFAADEIIADPYSKAVVSKNSYRHESKSIILDTEHYDWEGDTFVKTAWEDLIIYEMHVRDMTVHASAGTKHGGTYRGLVERGGLGGINHVLDLGVNAVELLPCQDFGNIEIPYEVEIDGVKNTWNPYARNHWGYMTTYFFAPESYYASDGTSAPDKYVGIHGQQVNEFRDMVKAFHKEGIAVIMDVVYNHVSQYDLNPFKLVDAQYFFDLDNSLKWTDAETGCGNQLQTSRPMVRRMIVDSIKYWMKEYHIDGFRFDLAAVLDWKTVDEITRAARKINPHVILIAEPWSLNSYAPAEFSDHGWAAWNDKFRNGIKGQNPRDGLGFIFGTYWNDDGKEAIERFIRGSSRDFGGQFITASHSVNYLASHDDYTLGDFIRIGSREVDPNIKITDPARHVKLSKRQLNLSKLAALLLMTSQGPTMIHAGQEFARSKIIAEADVPDKAIGLMDHNSYNKDNETNWLNFEQINLNRSLYDYYRGLIALRRLHPGLRRTKPADIQFLNDTVKYSVGYMIPRPAKTEGHDIVVLINANPTEPAKFVLPRGEWRKIANRRRVSMSPFGMAIKSSVSVPARSGMILLSKR